MRGIIPAALALLVACAGPSQSASGDGAPAGGQPPAQADPSTPAEAQQVTVELVPGEASSAGDGENSAAAEAGGRTVVVRGTASTPTPCHRLSARVEASGSQVTLRVSAAADPDAMCIQSIGAIPYTATIRGLPAGTYDLRVEHAYPGTGWSTAPALQTRVTVG
ncbi:MAG TPA: hypothetical protein VFR37_20890 [Longimicrobium sp.]|nr:hypothetical protein [Longimicrobium sp.]